jgi:hypothetical protein
MCIEHIINLVWHWVEGASKDQRQGGEEEEVNPMYEARGPQRQPISGASRLAV